MVHSAEYWAEEESFVATWLHLLVLQWGLGVEGGKVVWVPSAGLEEPSTLMGFFTSWWSLICLCHWWGEAKTTPSRIALLLEVVCTKPSVIGPALVEGIAALQQFPWGMCLSLWNPPAVLLLKKKIKFIFPQMQKACIPSEKLLLGYFGPCRKMPVA